MKKPTNFCYDPKSTLFKVDQGTVMQCRQCHKYYDMDYWVHEKECQTSEWVFGVRQRVCSWSVNYAYQIWFNYQCLLEKYSDRDIISPKEYLNQYNEAYGLSVQWSDIQLWYVFS